MAGYTCAHITCSQHVSDTHPYLYTHTPIYSHTHMHSHTHIYTPPHLHTYAHVRTHTQRCVLWLSLPAAAPGMVHKVILCTYLEITAAGEILESLVLDCSNYSSGHCKVYYHSVLHICPPSHISLHYIFHQSSCTGILSCT